MSNQPNWDKAPEGANLFWTNRWSCHPWFKRENGRLYNFYEPEGVWHNMGDAMNDVDPNSFIERPTINQQLTVPVVKEKFTTEKVVCSKTEPTTWDGQGLPPIGTECEARTASGWLKSIILYHGTGQCLGLVAVVFWFNGNENLAWCREFRPIKTDRDHWIDAAQEICKNPEELRSILGQMYDAVIAKLPEQK